jgi:hypothetical protein
VPAGISGFSFDRYDVFTVRDYEIHFLHVRGIFNGKFTEHKFVSCGYQRLRNRVLEKHPFVYIHLIFQNAPVNLITVPHVRIEGLSHQQSRVCHVYLECVLIKIQVKSRTGVGVTVTHVYHLGFAQLYNAVKIFPGFGPFSHP